MLHINDLSYRIQGRPLFEHATAGIPDGHKVGLVGRNGTGKTTLLRLIAGEIHPDDGTIGFPRTPPSRMFRRKRRAGRRRCLKRCLPRIPSLRR
jgi:ATPase subunit of ABC transporter with duplicated ATPase domains